jgi:hypothetical protein
MPFSEILHTIDGGGRLVWVNGDAIRRKQQKALISFEMKPN